MGWTIPQLAQNRQAFSNEVFVWLGVILVAAVLMALVALWLRRRFVQADAPASKLGFTLSDLREMHAQGQLSDEEFASAKAKMLAKSRQMLAENRDPGGSDTGMPEEVVELEEMDDPGEPVDNPRGWTDAPDKNGDPPAANG